MKSVFYTLSNSNNGETVEYDPTEYYDIEYPPRISVLYTSGGSGEELSVLNTYELDANQNSVNNIQGFLATPKDGSLFTYAEESYRIDDPSRQTTCVGFEPLPAEPYSCSMSECDSLEEPITCLKLEDDEQPYGTCYNMLLDQHHTGTICTNPDAPYHCPANYFCYKNFEYLNTLQQTSSCNSHILFETNVPQCRWGNLVFNDAPRFGKHVISSLLRFYQ
jgi:hypothetical protein